MTLEEIYTMLNGVEGGADAVASLRKEITSLRNEAKENRISKEEILNALNIKSGDEGKKQAESLSELAKKLKETNTTPDNVLAKINDLQKAVTDLTDKYEASEKTAKEAKEKQITSEKNALLVKTLTDAKAVSPTEIAKILIGQVQAGEDGKYSFVGADGKSVSVEDGIKTYLQANPWAVSSTGNAGGGTHAPADSGQHHYTEEELKTMSPEDINAHWDEISKSMKGENN